MEIMMFVVADPEIDGSEVDQEAVAEWDRVMAERGVLKRAMRLRPADEAKTVRVRGGEVIVTDGPFTESKEWIAGYDLLEVDRPRRGRGHRRGRPARPLRRARAPSGLAARDRRPDVEFMLFIATDPEAAARRGARRAHHRGVGRRDDPSQGLDRGDRLRPPEYASTVRVRGGDAIVTDGPFTESKEWIAGYDVIECADLDEAIEIASKHPMARAGRIEVRRAWPLGAPDE